MDAGLHIGDAKIHAHHSADCAGFCASAVRRPFRFFEFVRGAKGGSKSPKHRRLLLAGELGFEPRFSESESDVLPLNYSPTWPGRMPPTGAPEAPDMGQSG